MSFNIETHRSEVIAKVIIVSSQKEVFSMNKSIGFILCLLSARIVVASEEVGILYKGEEVTPDNFYLFTKEVYEERGQAPLMLALREMQTKVTKEALNPDLEKLGEDPAPLELAYEEDNPRLFEFALANGAKPHAPTVREDTIYNRAKSDVVYKELLDRYAVRARVEPFVVTYHYAANDSERSAVVSDLKKGLIDRESDKEKSEVSEGSDELVETTTESDEKSIVDELKERFDENKQESSEDVDVAVSDGNGEYTIEEIDASLELQKAEMLSRAQGISDIQALLKNEERQEILESGYSKLHLGAFLAVGLTAGYFLKQGIDDFLNNN